MRGNIFCVVCWLMVMVFYGCEKSEDITGADHINIVYSDDQKAITGEMTYSYNLDNCGQINVITAVKAKDGTYAELMLTLLTNGALVQVKYFKQHSEDEGHYRTPHLQVDKSFKVEDFNYDREDGNLSFRFNGTVYNEKEGDHHKYLEGRVEVEDLEYAPCQGLIFDVSADDPDFRFLSHHSSAGKSTQHTPIIGETIYGYHTYSTTGQFLSPRLAKDISQLVGKEVSFGVEGEPYGVRYAEYQGPMILQEGYGLIDHDWKEFQTKGKITDIQRVEGDKSVKPYYIGTIVMDILDQDKIVKEGVILPFATISQD